MIRNGYITITATITTISTTSTTPIAPLLLLLLLIIIIILIVSLAAGIGSRRINGAHCSIMWAQVRWWGDTCGCSTPSRSGPWRPSHVPLWSVGCSWPTWTCLQTDFEQDSQTSATERSGDSSPGVGGRACNEETSRPLAIPHCF